MPEVKKVVAFNNEISIFEYERYDSIENKHYYWQTKSEMKKSFFEKKKEGFWNGWNLNDNFHMDDDSRNKMKLYVKKYNLKIYPLYFDNNLDIDDINTITKYNDELKKWI